MSKPDTWMPLYIADYLADTTRLTTEQHGAYLLLIMDYWRNGPLPDDDAALAQVTRLQPAAWKKLRPAIARLFQIANGEWRHKRIDEELDKASQFIAKQKANGSKGGRPKKTQSNNPNESQKKPMGFDRDNPNHNPNKSPSPSPSPSPLTPSTDQSSSTAEPLPRETPAAATTIPDPPSDPGHWLLWFNASQGLSLDPASRFDRKGFWPLATRWCNAGLTIGTMQSAIDKAVAEAREPIAYLPAYVDRVLATQNAPPPTMTAAASSTLAAARTIFGTDIEDNHAHATGRIIDITPGLAERGDRVDIPRVAGQLRVTVSEPVEDGADHPGRL